MLRPALPSTMTSSAMTSIAMTSSAIGVGVEVAAKSRYHRVCRSFTARDQAPDTDLIPDDLHDRRANLCRGFDIRAIVENNEDIRDIE